VPANYRLWNTIGIAQHRSDNDKSGSFIAEGKQRSARANNTLVGGLPVADELVLEKAMKRAAARNLDGVPASQTSASLHTLAVVSF
jgi:hypothetical protein